MKEMIKSLVFALKGILLALITDLWPAIKRFFQLLCIAIETFFHRRKQGHVVNPASCIPIKHPAQRRNMLVEVVLLDEGIRPHQFEEFRLVHNLSVPFDQNRQRVEGLRRERNGRASTQEQALPDLDTEFAEFVNAWLWAAHDRAFTSFQDISAPF